MTAIRVLLAEDHETVREGLKLLIDAQADMEVVAEVSNGRTAIEQTVALNPDVVVMDLAMPGLNGLVATRELKQRSASAVVVLTRHDDDAYVQELLGAGALGYVLKRSASTELLAAIRDAVAGRAHLDAALGARMASGLRGKLSAQSAIVQPSERENQVLRLVAHGHSNKEVAGALGISVKTVEVHKANAMKKLGFRGRVDVIRYAVRKGWLTED